MGRVEEHIRVVVVSPGDVARERAVAQTLVDELNRGVARDRGCRLSLWRWEIDARPGMHRDGPQGLIDELMDIQDADVVVGVFWKRFGTSTGAADSGTEHELRRAWAAWQDRGRPEVMVYFCTRACSPKTPDELRQWQRVLEFQRALPEQQLWWPYETVAKFERLLREHLTALLLSRAAVPGPRRSEPGAGDARRPFPIPPALAANADDVVVGRAAELEALAGAYAEAARGRRRLVMLCGEPGIGKTRLATEFASRAHDGGAIVLYGRCDEEALLAQQPFVQALRHYVCACPLQELAGRSQFVSGELRPIVPELADRLPGLPEPLAGDSDGARSRLFEAVSALLCEAAQSRPVVLVLEDLHWADRATLLLLKYLVRYPRQARLMVLGTYRETELDVDDPLSATLAELGREHLLERLALTSLDAAEVSQLVGARAGEDASPELRRIVYERTEGNAFFVVEVLRHLVESGAIGSAGAEAEPGIATGSIAAPEGVKDVIGQRLARLGHETHRLLATASVLGQTFELDVLQRLSTLDEDELVEALESAVRARVIEEVAGAAGRFTFSHALIRDTLYGGLTATRRSLLHRRAGAALEDPGTPEGSRLAELAHHYLHAPPAQGRAKAGHYAILAARHALDVLAFEEAVRHYRAALSLLTHSSDAERRHELLLALGDAQFKAGDARGAQVTYREAGDTARRIGSATGFAKAALGCPQIFAPIVDEELVPLLEEALEWLGDEDPVLQSRLLSRLVIELSLSRDPERVSTLSEHALMTARRTGDRSALSAALSARRWALWTPESVGERQQVANEFLNLAVAAGSVRLTIQGHRWRLIDLFELGDIEGAEVAVEAFSSLAQQRRLPAELWWMEMFRTIPLLLAGRYAEAEEHSRAGFELGNRVGDPGAGSVHTLQMITIRRDRGGLEEFEDDVRANVARYPAIPGWRCVLAHMLCELGRLDEARHELDGLSPDAFDILPRDAIWLGAITYAAEVAARVDEHAEVLYELLLPFPDRNVVVGWTAACLGSSSRPLALLAAALGRRDDATAHFEDALAMNERMGAAPWLARTRVEYGQFLIADDRADPERAVALIERGLDGARRLGMVPLVESATRVLGQAR